jgi:hypothetical protein
LIQGRILKFLIALPIFIFWGCDILMPTKDNSVIPSLRGFIGPGTLYLQTDVDYPVTVTAADPQGKGDIQVVEIFIYAENNAVLLADTMEDGGTDGDIIPGDGVYGYPLRIDFAEGNPGNYRIEVSARDGAGHKSNTLEDTVSVVDEEMNFPPVLSEPMVPDTLKEETLSDVFLSIRVSDPQGLNDVDSVVFQVFPPVSPVPYFQGVLPDDGTNGDVLAGDSLFSILVSLEGELRDPPVLSNLSAPSSISRTAGQPILLSVKVTDAQGVGDIKSVYFNSFKPSGLPAENNPFFMFDDGEEQINGDENAGDGVFSLLIFISPENETGNYQFDFYAEDYSRGLGTCLFRFQAIDKNGLESLPLVAESIARLEGTVSDPLSRIIMVVE